MKEPTEVSAWLHSVCRANCSLANFTDKFENHGSENHISIENLNLDNPSLHLIYLCNPHLWASRTCQKLIAQWSQVAIIGGSLPHIISSSKSKELQYH